MDCLLDLPLVPPGHRIVGAHRDGFRIGILAAGRRNVLRDIHQHRAGPAAAGQIEGFLDGDGERAHVLDEEIVLDAGTGDADGIDLLEGILADVGGRHLAADDDQRYGIHVGGGDAGHRIGDARTRGHQRDADLLGRTRITVGGMDGALLVAHQHMTHLVLLEQLVVNEQHRAAGIAENIVDLFFLQAPDYNFRTSQHHRCTQKACISS